MSFVPESPMNDYLKETAIIDYTHPLIVRAARTLFGPQQADIEKVKAGFVFVRDHIHHSWDVQHTRVTCRASEVLQWQEGICYAKSHLLAALLRSQNIPVGFCYQRLMLFDTPEKGYCIHALNAVFIGPLNRWIRLDARGNKKGIDAQFSTEHEMLAFSVREAAGERDYPVIYCNPRPETIDTLRKYDNALDMYLHHLPDRI